MANSEFPDTIWAFYESTFRDKNNEWSFYMISTHYSKVETFLVYLETGFRTGVKRFGGHLQ